MNRTSYYNQNGQALVFVIATMTVALAVGVGVSLRNLSSISRTSRTDTSTRAQAAAEGGAENILSRDDIAIKALADSNPAGGVDEVIEFTPTTNDNVTAVAEVTVEYFNVPAGQNYLPIQLNKGQVTELNLEGSSVEVCWSSAESGKGSDLFFTAYNSTGAINKVGYSSSIRSGFPSNYYSNYESSGGGKDGFTNCVTPPVPSGVVGLRVRSINASSTLGIYSPSGNLPNQGYKITSVGKLKNVAQGDDAEAVVIVTRSFSYMPGLFDFGVFSGSTGDAL